MLCARGQRHRGVAAHVGVQHRAAPSLAAVVLNRSHNLTSPIMLCRFTRSMHTCAPWA